MDSNNSNFSSLPSCLQPQWQQFWQDLALADSALAQHLAQDANLMAQLMRVVTVSQYVANCCLHSPALLAQMIADDDFNQPLTAVKIKNQLRKQLADCNCEAEIMVALRHFRKRAMIRIIWRERCQLANLKEVLASLSALADCIITQTIAWLNHSLYRDLGQPVDDLGNPLSLLVVALGKLGGRELNLSSDIDLMFSYASDGQTTGGNSTLSNHDFFTRMAQSLIKLIGKLTVDGLVFRVDMRLRPFGDSGPLVMSFNALENYYQQQGREWERYALIKSRVITGTQQEQKALQELINPFVFRRYIDYGVLDSLREMKKLIVEQMCNLDIKQDIKNGSGGIREIEFTVQVFQLIRGGKVPALQRNSIFYILKQLVVHKLLTKQDIEQLTNAYIFLRQVEHCLQAVNDQQTQSLPGEQVEQQRLAYAMFFTSWHEFSEVISRHRQAVEAIFNELLAAPYPSGRDIAVDSEYSRFHLLWMTVLDDASAKAMLQAITFDDNDRILHLLRDFKQSARYQSLADTPRARLDQLMPLLLQTLKNNQQHALPLARILDVFTAIIRRSAYFVLLSENPNALRNFVQLCTASSWLGEQMSKYPLLFDELISKKDLFHLSSKQQLLDELSLQLTEIKADDLEQNMEALREFKLANMFRIAAADIMQHNSLLEISDQLTLLAEIILQHVLLLSWQQQCTRYPELADLTTADELPFGIIAYGKLASSELGYQSDLDLVFCYDEEQQFADDSLNMAEIYLRLAQRIVHLLSSHTISGVLYKVDTRLRPSGTAGLLVTSLRRFIQYQQQQAWTWEHQALVRARLVCGSKKMNKLFLQLRSKVLMQDRNGHSLRKHILAMRHKMLANKSVTSKHFHLKKSVGGITDIEFIVQYMVLFWSRKHPVLLNYVDTINLLKTAASEKLLTISDSEQLIAAYTKFRTHIHHLELQNEQPVIPCEQESKLRACVQAAWDEIIGN